MKYSALISQRTFFVSIMRIFQKIDGIDIGATGNVENPRLAVDFNFSTRLSTFIIKELPGVRSVRKEPDFGYASTPVSNSSGYRIYAGAEVRRKNVPSWPNGVHARVVVACYS